MLNLQDSIGHLNGGNGWLEDTTHAERKWELTFLWTTIEVIVSRSTPNLIFYVGGDKTLECTESVWTIENMRWTCFYLKNLPRTVFL